MQPGAGVADDRRLRARWLVWRVRQPMLHTHPGLGAFEYDVTAHAGPVMPAPVGHQNYGCLLRSHSRKWGFRHLIRQQLQNRLSPHIIFLILCGQQPAIVVKILPMNELLHTDLPGGARRIAACPLSHKRLGANLFRGPEMWWLTDTNQATLNIKLGRRQRSGRQPWPDQAAVMFCASCWLSTIQDPTSMLRGMALLVL